MPLTVAALVDQNPAISPTDAERYRRTGLWPGRTIRAALDAVVDAHPDREALVGYRSDGTTERWTYRDLDRQATHAASALASLGVEPGDVVAVMLPNWIEYGALIFGINELGAVYTALPVAYGERQAAAILRQSRARVLVIPRRWRAVEHLELARRLRADLPYLETVIVVGEETTGLVAGEVAWSSLAELRSRTFEPRSSEEICYLGFTSGTTGDPKGAMHSHDTLLHSAYQIAEHIGADAFGSPLIQLVASPTGHHTGYVWGVIFTVCMAGTGVHVDRWEAEWGIEIIRKEAVTTFFGAPTFVQDMMRTELAGDPDCPLTCLVVAGSSVPRSLPAQATAALGAYVAPAWGMTECSIIISCTPKQPTDILGTDGSVFTGSEVILLDPRGERITAPGTIGELLIRGPSVFLGYFERPDATEASFLPGGWFRTGDTATLDDHGWVSLQGRTKDIIIRGGENIPAVEVETLLFDHPAVLNAAVVGVPDERLGERACAVVVLGQESQLDLEELCDYLVAKGLSKHYLPEQLVVLDALPMTLSGKIQKFKLRDALTADRG